MKKVYVILSVVVGIAVAAGVSVLIWWLVAGRHDDFSVEVLEGPGFSDVQYTAAFTRIQNVGDMFWWFYPTEGSGTRPLLIWLDGVTGLPPSLLANFAMFGPLDFNLNRRNESWVDECNILFVDAPLGTGFSTANSAGNLPHNFDDNTDHLLYVLESFYTVHPEQRDAPLYIFGQGDGAQFALYLTKRLAQEEIIFQIDGEDFKPNVKGIVLGNGIVSPALVVNKLGFYLDEMGYIDPTGRVIVEEFSNELNALLDQGNLEEAFDKFLSLGEFINEEAGAVAVNMGHLLQKLTRDASRDYFGHRKYLRSALQIDDVDINQFMSQTVAPALGISTTNYDAERDAVLQALRGLYMTPLTDAVEYILENTDITVTIYNGNLDAITTTPGQLQWVNNLQWYGQEQFKNASRQTLVVNGLVQGYFRESDRLAFYWINAAGVSVPLDSPAAMKRVLQRII